MRKRSLTLTARPVTLAALVLVVALTGCQNAAQPRTLRGVVTEVQPRDLGHADTITVRSEDGDQVQFRVADSVLFTPGHLREHLIFAEPVTVTYLVTESGYLATEITD
jgi:hypothetical protein